MIGKSGKLLTPEEQGAILYVISVILDNHEKFERFFLENKELLCEQSSK